MTRRGFQLAKIADIRVFLDPSLAIIFLLILLQLGTGLLPQWRPQWGPWMTWGVALATAIVFFASILVHELSHAFVARAFGMRIRTITLFLFGGAADLEEQPSTPGAEFWTAIVGPVTSIVLGAMCLVAVATLGTQEVLSTGSIEDLSRLGPVLTILAWAGPINIMLGLFNLVPGFPLDGGRVLRSILWRVTDDIDRATRIASDAGRIFAGLLIATGIAMAFGVSVPVFGRGIIGGVWLVLIGWFLWRAAAGSYQQLLAEEALAGVLARDLMVPPAIVTSDLSLAEFTRERLMKDTSTAFEVVDDGATLRGMVSLEDVRRVPRSAWATTYVDDVMTPRAKLLVAELDSSLEGVFQKMLRRGVAEVPVVSAEILVGVLRRADVLRWIQLQMPLSNHGRPRRSGHPASRHGEVVG